ncbi:MAG: hypothetical protein L3K24_06355 [Gammaproteobacteria bacterium]|nr:hypothetical protein [Gammaproteobacteria bacterium]
MQIKHIGYFIVRAFFISAMAIIAGCGQAGVSSSAPSEGPAEVLKKFYGYIEEAKLKGGPSPAREAFKLIDAEHSQLIVEQFLEVVKKYPPDFQVEVGEAEINGNGTQATVAISYKMASSFGGHYTVNEVIPLTLDKKTNSWKVDFTGETDDMDREAVTKNYKEMAHQGK